MTQTEVIRQRMHSLYEQYTAAEKELHSLEADSFRVCIFGSARTAPQEPIYETVRKLARTLGSLGIDIVTGGGPGLMDAANQGVKEAHYQGTQSIGLLIALPNHNELANPHLDIKSEHTRFSTRLDEFMRMSHGVIVAPGGIGTLLELTYTWQLIQVHLMEPRPVVLLGREFWLGLLDWMRSQQLQHHLIDPGDLDFVHLADTEAEVLDLIRPALEKFRSQKRDKGDNPRADQAETMLDQVEEAKNQPERQQTFFQNIG